MSNGGTPLDAPVVRRIRVLTALAWVAGALVAVFTAWGALDDLGVLEGAPIELFQPDDPDAYPWERAEPRELAIADDGAIDVPAGGGVIHLPADPEGRIQQLVAGDGFDGWIDVSLTPPGESPENDEYFWPDSVGYMSSAGDQVFLLPRAEAAELEVWIEADGDAVLRLGPVDSRSLTAAASGEGDALLLYEGDHLSARVVHRGDGIFFVDTFTPAGDGPSVTESGSIDQRFSWDEGPILIRIETDGAWTIEIDGETAG